MTDLVKVALFRSRFSLVSTQGVMGIDGSSKFVTLEPPRVSGMLMPAGTYRCIKSMSADMHYVSPELQNVPGHVGERIHVGNFPKDTHGCILVGMCNGGLDMISESQVAFDQLMALTPDQFDIQITDQPEAFTETT